MPSSRHDPEIRVEGLIARYRGALAALAADDLDEVRGELAGADAQVRALVEGPPAEGPVSGLDELLAVQAELASALRSLRDEVAHDQQELGKARRMIGAGKRGLRTGRLLDSEG